MQLNDIVANAIQDTHGVTGDGWYGFDLDGTLARYDGWKGIDHIGEPISEMVALIKRLHAEGKSVKIVTARVAPRDDTVDGHDARYYVCQWCAKHLGFTPDVVAQKDARMIQLYDDRVKQVIPNSGILVENLGNAAAMREALELAYRELQMVLEMLPSSTGRYVNMFSKRETTRRKIGLVIDTASSALAAPARNCDVGTAEEQEKRFDTFCDSHKWVDDGGVNACLPDCPLYKTVDCAIHWSQMPYAPAEGETK